jgi:dihydrofolate reductase
MGKLTYGMMVSLDGYIADPDGKSHFHMDEEIHRFANNETRKYGTEIYGRRMYETMVYWENHEVDKESSAYEDEFALIWRGLDKLVVSSTLDSVSSARTRLVREVQPDEIRRLKATSENDISVAGPTLAASFINAGLVDEYGLYCMPVVFGGGTPMFKDLDRRLDLALVEEHRFASGVIFMRYAPRATEDAS